MGLDNVATAGFVPNLIQLGCVESDLVWRMSWQLGLCQICSVCVVGDMVEGLLVRSWPMGVVWFVVMDWLIKGARQWCVVLSFGNWKLEIEIWELSFDFSFSAFLNYF